MTAKINYARLVIWIARDIARRVDRLKLRAGFLFKTLTRPIGTIFTCQGKTVNRLKYTREVLRGLKQYGG